MKRILKQIQCFLLIFLIAFSLISYYEPVNVYAATSIGNYICNPSSVSAYGYDSTLSDTSHGAYIYKNSSLDWSKYVVASNAIYNNGTYYDLLIYPWTVSTDSKAYGAVYYKLTGITSSTIVGFGPSKSGNYSMGALIYVTQHGNTGSKVSWTGFVGANDLDKTEYAEFPSGFTAAHIGKNLTQSGTKFTGKTDTDNTSKTEQNNYNAVMGQVTIPNTGAYFYFGCNGYKATAFAFGNLKDYVVTDSYTIEFDANGGDSANVPNYLIKIGNSNTVVMGDIEHKVPTRVGYKFKGWSASTTYSSSNKRIAYTSTDVANGTSDSNLKTTNSSWTYKDYCDNTNGNSSERVLRLYAQWEANNYTITFKQNKPTNMSSTISGRANNSTVTVTYDSTANNRVTTCGATGWTFNGWYTASSGGTKVYNADGTCNTSASSYWSPSKTWKYAGNVTLYAQWTPRTYTLTFNPSTPSNASHSVVLSPTSKTVTYDSVIGAVPTPSLKGWILQKNSEGKHWYIGNDYIDANTYWRYTESKTAYVSWKPIEYDIYYDKGLTTDREHSVVVGATRNTNIQSILRINKPYTHAIYDSNVQMASLGDTTLLEKLEGNHIIRYAKNNDVLLGRMYVITFDGNYPTENQVIKASYDLEDYDITGTLPSAGYWVISGQDSDVTMNLSPYMGSTITQPNYTQYAR